MLILLKTQLGLQKTTLAVHGKSNWVLKSLSNPIESTDMKKLRVFPELFCYYKTESRTEMSVLICQNLDAVFGHEESVFPLC